MIACVLSRLFATPRTVAPQRSLPLGFSRQEYWNGFSFHPSEGLPDPGIKSMSSELASRFFTTEPPGKPKLTLIPDMNSILSIYEPKMYSGQCLICLSICKCLISFN
ncbi:unnamed protein product [Rangifer tarandus platyrhynchus]|uniref:Uncharacterized protein n=1 Tax=Rangifer tarandus platyrhynchus TaxID=3082113 RepID=A0ABN8ZK52_RANTA|nr:unnamed protein product [Rangifer tarandus platyrhynchus]